MKKPYRWKLNLIGFGKYLVWGMLALLLAGLGLLAAGLRTPGWIVCGIGIGAFLLLVILLGIEQHQDREMNEWRR